MTLSGRDAELLNTQTRAFYAAKNVMMPGTGGTTAILHAPTLPNGDAVERFPVGTVMSGILTHGGIHVLMDEDMMAKRFDGMMMGMAACNSPASMLADMRAAMTAAKSVPAFFFYHLVDNPYPLHSQLVSYLSHPARHHRIPNTIKGDHTTNLPEGKTYSQNNTPSPSVPAAATFIGQFIDHDLTLNALNLFDTQGGSGVRDQASPLIDLDSVYGPRLDDTATRQRVIPMTNGMFCLDPIAGSNPQAYDVCRQLNPSTCKLDALIGDKRNDENQLILQVHIAAMRLHNHFMNKHRNFTAAKRDTILHWQAMVATYYLPLVARPEAITAVKGRLFAHLRGTASTPPLCHRPGLTVCDGTTLGMPHEFAIGFRFGHSQLRSAYKLAPGGEPIRLFDPLAPAKYGGQSPDDLVGGKALTAGHVIDWPFFTNANTQASNLIDHEVNEVVFALPEGTIPDDIKLVNNLPARNLIRSDKLSLCAGEDLADCYAACYPELGLTRLTRDEVEPDDEYQVLFQIAPEENCDPTKNSFRTPLWYYLLREAEVERLRKKEKEGDENFGKLGMVGSLLIAEVILSGIRYAQLTLPPPEGEAVQPDKCVSRRHRDSAPCSIFLDPVWANQLSSWTPADQALINFKQIVELGRGVVPPTCPPPMPGMPTA